MLLFTSTVFNYYSFNFLPDAAALGFTLIGWHYYFKYEQIELKITLYKSFLYFTLGSLIKITYLIYPLSVLTFIIFERLWLKKNYHTLIKQKRILISSLLSFFIVIVWNVYVLFYNHKYQFTSFNTKALPIWDLNTDNIIEVWSYINQYWYSKYFAHSSVHLLFLIIIF